MATASLVPVTRESLNVSTVKVSGKDVSFGLNKSGTGLVLVSQKDLGALLGIKGKALKRAHFAYRIEAGKALNAGISAKMAAGEWISKSVLPTAKGFRVTFDDVAKLEDPGVAPAPTLEDAMGIVAKAAGMSVEEFRAAMGLDNVSGE